jgi:hypothetical protein
MKDFSALVKQLDSTLQKMKYGPVQPPPVLQLPPPNDHCTLASLPTRSDLPAIIELPRYCAVYDGEMWLARYGREGDRYTYKTSVSLTASQKYRYGEEHAIILPTIFQNEPERCACCGSWSLDGNVGAVLCPSHNKRGEAYVCYGNTSPTGYFTCSSSCKFHGQLEPFNSERFGLMPGRRIWQR